ncbi:hypothetical protein BESB_014120 [Besnoitia besnoiti]|uniref:Uncharacterized protein n=1 Tax=Besnoitia besnoiti TaxID=94643 RepID=A0A2A9MBM9_BESBE|nr:hypothetical protein BESB_014120 [Besnoitia besnoiti]PFH32800.1 hypothetical protein BESB_014120 [Besnoitia besnoiti]
MAQSEISLFAAQFDELCGRSVTPRAEWSRHAAGSSTQSPPPFRGRQAWDAHRARWRDCEGRSTEGRRGLAQDFARPAVTPACEAALISCNSFNSYRLATVIPPEPGRGTWAEGDDVASVDHLPFPIRRIASKDAAASRTLLRELRSDAGFQGVAARCFSERPLLSTAELLGMLNMTSCGGLASVDVGEGTHDTCGEVPCLAETKSAAASPRRKLAARQPVRFARGRGDALLGDERTAGCASGSGELLPGVEMEYPFSTRTPLSSALATSIIHEAALAAAEEEAAAIRATRNQLGGVIFRQAVAAAKAEEGQCHLRQLVTQLGEQQAAIGQELEEIRNLQESLARQQAELLSQQKRTDDADGRQLHAEMQSDRERRGEALDEAQVHQPGAETLRAATPHQPPSGREPSPSTGPNGVISTPRPGTTAWTTRPTSTAGELSLTDNRLAVPAVCQPPEAPPTSPPEADARRAHAFLETGTTLPQAESTANISPRSARPPASPAANRATALTTWSAAEKAPVAPQTSPLPTVLLKSCTPVSELRAPRALAPSHQQIWRASSASRGSSLQTTSRLRQASSPAPACVSGSKQAATSSLASSPLRWCGTACCGAASSTPSTPRRPRDHTVPVFRRAAPVQQSHADAAPLGPAVRAHDRNSTGYTWALPVGVTAPQYSYVLPHPSRAGFSPVRGRTAVPAANRTSFPSSPAGFAGASGSNSVTGATAVLRGRSFSSAGGSVHACPVRYASPHTSETARYVSYAPVLRLAQPSVLVSQPAAPSLSTGRAWRVSASAANPDAASACSASAPWSPPLQPPRADTWSVHTPGAAAGLAPGHSLRIRGAQPRWLVVDDTQKSVSPHPPRHPRTSRARSTEGWVKFETPKEDVWEQEEPAHVSLEVLQLRQQRQQLKQQRQALLQQHLEREEVERDRLKREDEEGRVLPKRQEERPHRRRDKQPREEAGRETQERTRDQAKETEFPSVKSSPETTATGVQVALPLLASGAGASGALPGSSPGRSHTVPGAPGRRASLQVTSPCCQWTVQHRAFDEDSPTTQQASRSDHSYELGTQSDVASATAAAAAAAREAAQAAARRAADGVQEAAAAVLEPLQPMQKRLAQLFRGRGQPQETVRHYALPGTSSRVTYWYPAGVQAGVPPGRMPFVAYGVPAVPAGTDAKA